MYTRFVVKIGGNMKSPKVVRFLGVKRTAGHIPYNGRISTAVCRSQKEQWALARSVDFTKTTNLNAASTNQVLTRGVRSRWPSASIARHITPLLPIFMNPVQPVGSTKRGF